MSTGDHGKFYNSHTLGPTPPSQTGNSSRYDSSISIADSSSLSTNYLPTKFGGGLVSRKRQGKEASVTGVPKRGGGRDAFKPNEPRMPGTHDEDYDGVQGPWFGPNAKKPILRWTRFKWIMFVANIFVRPFPINPPCIATERSFAVNRVLPRCPGFLSPHVVPCLGSSGCCASRKQGGTCRFYCCCYLGDRDIFGRLGWYSSQQSGFPRLVHFSFVDLLRLPRHTWLCCLQEAYFQSGRKAQQPMVAGPRCGWSTGDPESAWMLRVLQSFRVGDCFAIMLCQECPSRLQGFLHEVSTYHLAAMVHHRLHCGATSPLRNDLGSSLFEPRHIPIWEGNDA